MTALPKVTEEEQVQLDYERTLRHILFFGGSATPPVFPIDFFWSGDSGTIGDTMAVATLQAASTERFVGATTWTMTAEALARMTIQASQGTMPTACRIGATGFAKTGWTRGLSTPQKYDNNEAKLEFGTSGFGPPRVSASCWFKVTLSVNNNKDIFHLDKSGGGYVIANIQNVGGGVGAIRCHGDGGVGFGSSINFNENTWYFLTLLGLRQGESVLRIYNTAGTLVGESTFTTTQDTGFRYLRMGRTDGTGDLVAPNDGGEIQICNVMIDYCRGVYPLGIEYDATDYPVVPPLDDTDSFDRADGAMGAGWVEQIAGFAIASNKAVSSVAAAPYALSYRAGTFNQAQYSEAVIGDATGFGQLCGVAVRCSGIGASANAVVYAARIGSGRSLELITNGVVSNINNVTFNAWALGDTVRLVVDGNFVALYRKPSGSGTYTFLGRTALNNTHATGNPGIYGGRTSGAATTCKLDSWAGGNLVN